MRTTGHRGGRASFPCAASSSRAFATLSDAAARAVASTVFTPRRTRARGVLIGSLRRAAGAASHGSSLDNYRTAAALAPLISRCGSHTHVCGTGGAFARDAHVESVGMLRRVVRLEGLRKADFAEALEKLVQARTARCRPAPARPPLQAAARRAPRLAPRSVRLRCAARPARHAAPASPLPSQDFEMESGLTLTQTLSPTTPGL